MGTPAVAQVIAKQRAEKFMVAKQQSLKKKKKGKKNQLYLQLVCRASSLDSWNQSTP